MFLVFSRGDILITLRAFAAGLLVDTFDILVRILALSLYPTVDLHLDNRKSRLPHRLQKNLENQGEIIATKK